MPHDVKTQPPAEVAKAAPVASPAPAGSSLGKQLRTALPILISVAALYLVYRRVPFADVRQALEGAELGWFVPLMVMYFGSVLAADSLALTQTLRWFLCDARFVEILPMRASTYLLALVNYHLGQGGLALYLARTKPGVTLTAAAGTILFMMGINLLLILGTAAAGNLVAGTALPSLIGLLLKVAMGALPFYLLIIAGFPRALSSRLERIELLRPLFRAGLSGHAKAAAIRVPHICVMLLGHFLALRCFHVYVPLGDAIAALPLILLVGALPIAVQGIGPVQAASILLLAQFSTAPTPALREAAVVAESLAMSSLFLLLQLVTGLLLLPRAMRDLTGTERASPP